MYSTSGLSFKRLLSVVSLRVHGTGNLYPGEKSQPERFGCLNTDRERPILKWEHPGRAGAHPLPEGSEVLALFARCVYIYIDIYIHPRLKRPSLSGSTIRFPPHRCDFRRAEHASEQDGLLLMAPPQIRYRYLQSTGPEGAGLRKGGRHTCRPMGLSNYL